MKIEKQFFIVPTIFVVLVACASSPSTDTNSIGGGTGGSVSTAPVGGTSGGNTNTGTDPIGASCDALPLPTDPNDVIGTFEDGLGGVNQDAPGRGGGFYAYNDGTGTQTPAPDTGEAPNATAVSRCGSTFAMCSNGKGFTTWGAGIGTDMGVASGDSKSPYDASQYKGIAFWAKIEPGSLSNMRIKLPDKSTAPEGGICDENAEGESTYCFDDWGSDVTLEEQWKPYTILFSDLAQEGWGMVSSGFDPSTLYSLQFQVSDTTGAEFSFCIDDLILVR